VETILVIPRIKLSRYGEWCITIIHHRLIKLHASPVYIAASKVYQWHTATPRKHFLTPFYQDFWIPSCMIFQVWPSLPCTNRSIPFNHSGTAKGTDVGRERKGNSPIMLGDSKGCTLPKFYIINLVLLEFRSVNRSNAEGEGWGLKGFWVVYAQWQMTTWQLIYYKVMHNRTITLMQRI